MNILCDAFAAQRNLYLSDSADFCEIYGVGGVEKDTPNENLFNSTEKYGAISLYSNLSQELDSAFQELMTNDIQYPHKI